MLHESYRLVSAENPLLFKFISEGPKGRIVKIIQYNETRVKGVYNLVLGDQGDSNDINDLVISNNGDSKKVLATVALSVYLFTERYPEAWVVAIGNTKVKTRLYQIGITSILDQVRDKFELYGIRNGKSSRFVKNSMYDGFLIRRKKVYL